MLDNVGLVLFQNGRVSSIERYVNSVRGNQSLELANELRSALERLQEATTGVIVVNLKDRRSAPGMRMTPIEFSSDAGVVRLHIIEGEKVKGGPVINIQEGLTIDNR